MKNAESLGRVTHTHTQVNLNQIKERKNRSRDVSFYVVCSAQITRNAHLFLRCKGPPKTYLLIEK